MFPLGRIHKRLLDHPLQGHMIILLDRIYKIIDRSRSREMNLAKEDLFELQWNPREFYHVLNGIDQLWADAISWNDRYFELLGNFWSCGLRKIIYGRANCLTTVVAKDRFFRALTDCGRNLPKEEKPLRESMPKMEEWLKTSKLSFPTLDLCTMKHIAI